MRACIYYHPEAYTTSGPKLMGRNAAGESFLRGFLQHSTKSDALWLQVQDAKHVEQFTQTARQFARQEAIKWVDKSRLAELSQVGCVYYPGPGIGEYAWQRSFYGHQQWSLCGITHTTSSTLAMDAITQLISAPVQPWDAVICTSNAVKDNVQRLLQAQVDYLQRRLGMSQLVLPQLPVIPLGIHTQDFIYSDEQRRVAREAIGVEAQNLVVLFMGRLSFHAKAHPLAMYQALEAAAQRSGRTVVLLECGWHANSYIANAYQDAARRACPSVRVVTLDGRKATARDTAWASADVFCSLSDNIQETFGIVPIEAMAAGLPVVVSDWDGYKDTVRDGVDGFRIPTLMPPAGLGADLAQRHALEIDTYDMYCGHSCSLIAVDIEATTRALVRLFDSPSLRAQMGAAGRLRAQSMYDWSVIIAQYQTLWAELETIRLAASAVEPLTHPWPARLEPFHSFASYPSHTLQAQTQLALVDASAEVAFARIQAYGQLAMVNFATFVMPNASEIKQLLDNAQQGPQQASALLAGIAIERHALVFRALLWLLKLGILRTVP